MDEQELTPGGTVARYLAAAEYFSYLHTVKAAPPLGLKPWQIEEFAGRMMQGLAMFLELKRAEALAGTAVARTRSRGDVQDELADAHAAEAKARDDAAQGLRVFAAHAEHAADQPGVVVASWRPAVETASERFEAWVSAVKWLGDAPDREEELQARIEEPPYHNPIEVRQAQDLDRSAAMGDERVRKNRLYTDVGLMVFSHLSEELGRSGPPVGFAAYRDARVAGFAGQTQRLVEEALSLAEMFRKSGELTAGIHRTAANANANRALERTAAVDHDLRHRVAVQIDPEKRFPMWRTEHAAPKGDEVARDIQQVIVAIGVADAALRAEWPADSNGKRIGGLLVLYAELLAAHMVAARGVSLAAGTVDDHRALEARIFDELVPTLTRFDKHTPKTAGTILGWFGAPDRLSMLAPGRPDEAMRHDRIVRKAVLDSAAVLGRALDGPALLAAGTDGVNPFEAAAQRVVQVAREQAKPYQGAFEQMVQARGGLIPEAERRGALTMRMVLGPGPIGVRLRGAGTDQTHPVRLFDQAGPGAARNTGRELPGPHGGLRP